MLNFTEVLRATFYIVTHIEKYIMLRKKNKIYICKCVMHGLLYPLNRILLEKSKELHRVSQRQGFSKYPVCLCNTIGNERN